MQYVFQLDRLLLAFLCSLFLFSMTTLGASSVFFTRRFGRRPLAFFNGFGAGIMISASFFSLLLPALAYSSTLPSWTVVSLGFLTGGAFMIASDFFFSRKSSGEKELSGAKMLLFAVTLHNIPEGMAVGVAVAEALSSQSAVLGAVLLAVGIGVQNFPEGMCVAFPLRKSFGKGKSFLLSTASGSIEIPSCLIGALLSTLVVGLMPWALSFSAGAMIAVAASELIPESFSSDKTLSGIGLCVGFALMMALDVALG